MIRDCCAAPHWAPLRVDFAGGWLDVPQLAEDGQFIVNCAITPGLTLDDNWAAPGSGLGGSAAWSVLQGKDPMEFELLSGVGWQDPAVIVETGLCVWRSGRRPDLELKQSADWLSGLMALKKMPGTHITADLVKKDRDYGLICEAGAQAKSAVEHKDIDELALAITLTVEAQTDEGMDCLPEHNEMAAKYCGSGYGGYALYLFKHQQERGVFVDTCEGIAIEPYCRWKCGNQT